MDLVKYERMCKEVSEVTSFFRAKEYRDRLIGIEAFAKMAKNKALEADAWEIRIRCERKIGELMNAQRGVIPKPLPLATNGIDKNLAHRARRLWGLSYKDFTLMLSEGRKEVERSVERTALAKVIRSERHRRIVAGAKAVLSSIGPFSVIYADPPWAFKTYSDKGKDRSADMYYPTLSYEDIVNFTVQGKPISDIAHKDAALFLWCTSSNILTASDVMRAWDFEYKTHAVWVKDKIGLGLVFRNQHEVLLFGTRGNMPGPQFQPSSVFTYPRGRHSAKPPEIRKNIEKMYPDFDAQTRLELFARETVEGWSAYGFEANNNAAA